MLAQLMCAQARPKSPRLGLPGLLSPVGVKRTVRANYGHVTACEPESESRAAFLSSTLHLKVARSCVTAQSLMLGMHVPRHKEACSCRWQVDRTPWPHLAKQNSNLCYEQVASTLREGSAEPLFSVRGNCAKAAARIQASSVLGAQSPLKELAR